ncbi:hypothetical protein [Actinomadura rudentiformis]|uniref:Uncharacterized protein n=1 Tax=Actinomadura rudentiformis TaxID=359158 RepID=A0A6H9Z2H3_9ACTN|nr:hypothetical protein [Actinomadura rudentiformis]KAB2349732.1 hypothetical protein F8566_13405 [Actinomadura rudentiformis]
MGFFNSVPEDEDEVARPSWRGPDDTVMGAILPLNLVLGANEGAAVALREIIVHPEGGMLDIYAVARRADASARQWKAIRSSMNSGCERAEYTNAAKRSLRLGVLFRDGSRATTVDCPVDLRFSDDDEEPRPPILGLWRHAEDLSTDEHEYVSMRYWLWLWPLPPSEPFKLIVEWPAAGLEESAVEIDGAAVSELTAYTRNYWR